MTSFALPYSDTGLLGVIASAPDHEAGRLVDTIAGFLKDAASVKAAPAELDRAKKACKLALLTEAESRAGARDGMGDSLLRSSALTQLSASLAAVDAVTAGDVADVAKAALGTSVSIAAIGSLTTLPRYDMLASLFK